jgi:flagellar basal body-associated protein FliL
MIRVVKNDHFNLIILEDKFMSKKIAFVLIMVMFTNMVAWADSSSSEGEDSTAIIVIGVIAGILILTGCIIGIMEVAEADTPDDGIRLASMQTGETVPKTNFGPVLNFLQHIEIGQTQNNRVYVGFRLQY